MIGIDVADEIEPLKAILIGATPIRRSVDTSPEGMR
jgi:hypothetical protein